MHLIHTASIPGEGGELGLYQRGEDYFIKIVDGQDLMNTRAHASEDALGVIACKGVRERPRARVLIGGLGMGAGSDIRGIAVGGLGMGVGENLSGIAVGGLGMGIGENLTAAGNY